MLKTSIKFLIILTIQTKNAILGKIWNEKVTFYSFLLPLCAKAECRDTAGKTTCHRHERTAISAERAARRRSAILAICRMSHALAAHVPTTAKKKEWTKLRYAQRPAGSGTSCNDILHRGAGRGRAPRGGLLVAGMMPQLLQRKPAGRPGLALRSTAQAMSVAPIRRKKC